MSTIAFLGLGITGGPMAANQVAAGHEVVGFNRSPAAVERLFAAGREAGTCAVDARVSGGEVGARVGTLSIMVGAEEDDFTVVQPILEVMGATVVRVGPPGSGQTVKAANQMIVAGNLDLVAEARERGVTIPLGAVVAQLVCALRTAGDGGLDHSALLRGVRRLSGVEVSGGSNAG